VLFLKLVKLNLGFNTWESPSTPKSRSNLYNCESSIIAGTLFLPKSFYQIPKSQDLENVKEHLIYGDKSIDYMREVLTGEVKKRILDRESQSSESSNKYNNVLREAKSKRSYLSISGSDKKSYHTSSVVNNLKPLSNRTPPSALDDVKII